MSIDGEFEDEPMVDGEAARRRTDPPARRGTSPSGGGHRRGRRWGAAPLRTLVTSDDRQYELVERVRAYDPQADETS